MKNEIRFDMEAAIQALREGKGLSGKDGVLTPLIKQLTEAAMKAELDAHLAASDEPNRKNGCTPKKVKSPVGAFELQTPRDRAGRFEPQLVKKRQTHLTDELERKIIALFGLGNSYRDIRSHIAEIYGMSLSNGTLNAITDKLLPELQAWRERDLEAIYPIVWLDAIHYKIRASTLIPRSSIASSPRSATRCSTSPPRIGRPSWPISSACTRPPRSM